MRQGQFGLYCATKNEDGSWCKEKGKQNQGGGNPVPHSTAPQAPKENRNWDKEAYEKCCSIWAAARLGAGMKLADICLEIDNGVYSRLFDAIREHADKRFATGWANAEATLRRPVAETPADIVNQAIDEARDEAPSVEDIPW